MRKKSIFAGLASLLVASVLTTPAASAAPAVDAAGVVRHLTGSLSNGATWVADLPAVWNGGVVLYSHGFNPGPANPARNSPDQATADALLARGFALAGSSYAHAGWALDTAVGDQLDTLSAVTGIIGEPREVFAFGTSMGGLVSALLSERAGDRIDGTLTTCGLVSGGLNLNNFQFDATYAVARLLLPGQEVQLTGFTTAEQANATVAKLTDALKEAQKSSTGRARIALAAALMNSPTWFSGDIPTPDTDPAAQQEAEYNWLLGTLPFVIMGRVSINAVAGGDSSWNAGVNYAQLIRRSARFPQITKLYRQAGLDLGADLDTLTRNATTKPKPAAVRWLARTSVPSGDLAVPELTLHTIADNLAPVEMQREYGEKVHRAGDAGLLRQAYVQRVGHCRFTAAELVAGLLALQGRVRTGTWGNSTDPAKLQSVAEGLDLGGAAFMRYQPGPLVSDRADWLVRSR